MNSTNPKSPRYKKASIHRNRGSALIVILVAVALFGALSYVVSSMLRADSGVSAMSEQQAGLHASEVLSYASSLRRAVQNLKISNGCDETELSFEKPPFDNSDGYRNANSPSDFSCHVFHPDGGGLSPGSPDLDWQDAAEAAARSGITEEYLITSNICIPAVGTGDTDACGSSGNSDSELLLVVPFLTPVMCRVLNQELGISNSTIPDFGTFTQFLADHSEKFIGSYPTTKSSAGSHADIFAQKSFCAQDTTSGSAPGGGHHFYATLLAR